METWDDSDAPYRPKKRDSGLWGVWDKAGECWADDRQLTRTRAGLAAAKANDSNAAAENATWD